MWEGRIFGKKMIGDDQEQIFSKMSKIDAV